MSPLMAKTPRTRILDYIKKHKEFYVSDIAYALDLDYNEVCSVLDSLKKSGIISSYEPREREKEQ